MKKLKHIKLFERFINESEALNAKRLIEKKTLNSNITIEKITESDNIQAIDVLYSSFSKFVNSKEELLNKIKPRLNNDLSICLKLDGMIIGVYLLNEKSINDFIKSIHKDEVSDFKKNDTVITLSEDLSDNGLQGIAFSILPEYRNLGYGNLLKKYIDKLTYEYIWGVQDKKLNNINHWLKSRKIFAESSNRYATYKKL